MNWIFSCFLSALFLVSAVAHADTTLPQLVLGTHQVMHLHTREIGAMNQQIMALKLEVAAGKTKLEALKPEVRKFCEAFLSAKNDDQVVIQVSDVAKTLDSAVAAKVAGMEYDIMKAIVGKPQNPVQQCLDMARSQTEQVVRSGTAMLAFMSRQSGGCVDGRILIGATNGMNQSFITTSCPKRFNRTLPQYTGKGMDAVDRELAAAIRGDANGGGSDVADIATEQQSPQAEPECTADNPCAEGETCQDGECVEKPEEEPRKESKYRFLPRFEGLTLAGPEDIVFLGGGGGLVLEMDFTTEFSSAVTATGGMVGSVSGSLTGAAPYTSLLLEPFILKTDSKLVSLGLGYRMFQADGVNGLWSHSFNVGLAYRFKPWLEVQGAGFVGGANHYRADYSGVAGGGFLSFNLRL